MTDSQRPVRRPTITSVKVRARDEDFRIVRVVGNLFACTKQTGSWCCGWEEKGADAV